MADRVDRAVDGEPSRVEFVQRPRGLRGHGPRAGTERSRRPSGDPLEYAVGLLELPAESVAAQVVQEPVVVTRAADLVACCGDLCNELRSPLRDPTEAEERRLRAAAREQVEQPARRVHASELEALPLRTVDAMRHVEDLEPVLHIDRQCVCDRHGRSLRASTSSFSSSARQRASAASKPPGPSAYVSTRSRKPSLLLRNSARGAWCRKNFR